MILNLAYDAVLARVQLTADVIVDRKTVKVERSLNQLLWQTVRGGAAVPVVGGSVALDDYEFVSDVINYYRVTPLDFVAGFETNTAGWEAVGGTFARSTAQFFDGAASGLLTPDGVAIEVKARTTFAASPPVVPDTTYTFTAWVFHALGRNVDISVQHFDAANVAMDFETTLTTVTVPANTWTRITGTKAAPANAAKARLTVKQAGTPPATALLYIDEVEYSPVAFPAETASLIPSLGGQVWLKSIRHPFLNRKITVTDFSDVERPARGGLFDVKGRSVPVEVSDVRGSQRFTIDLKTETLTESRDLDLMVASGGPMFVHVPADCPVPGGYVALGDTGQRRPTRSAKSPRRYITLPCTVIAAPGPDVVGGTMTWGAVLNLYADWNNLLASNPTWADLLADVASLDDLVVL